MRASSHSWSFAALAAGLVATPALGQDIPQSGNPQSGHPGFDCNLLGPTEPCDPYLLYPLGQDLRLTVRTQEAHNSNRAEGKINTLRELFTEIRACWRPPALDQARKGMEITIRLSFKRDGTINGEPRFTYMTHAASDEQRKTYRSAVLDSIRQCAPLPFTKGLGGAIAGRPLVIRYIDNRNTQTTGKNHG
jgi:hypothetical protein